MEQEYRLVSKGKGAVIARLPPEQAKLLREEGMGFGAYTTGNLGFFDPSLITRYECTKCCKEYIGRPNVQVDIENDPAEKEPAWETIVGHIWYKCGTCDEIVMDGPALRNDPIKPEYVRSDESGVFIRPTRESIDEKLKEALEYGRSAIGCDLNVRPYHRQLAVAQRWAEKISYTIPPERIKEIEQAHDDAWLADYHAHMKENLKEILGRGVFTLEPDDPGGGHGFEMSGASERFFRFYTALPRLKIPDDSDIQGLVCAVLKSYQQMHEAELQRKQDTLKELEKDTQETSKNVDAVKGDIEKLLQQHRIPKEVWKQADHADLIW